jgi:hypothetical protein
MVYNKENFTSCRSALRRISSSGSCPTPRLSSSRSGVCNRSDNKRGVREGGYIKPQSRNKKKLLETVSILEMEIVLY